MRKVLILIFIFFSIWCSNIFLKLDYSEFDTKLETENTELNEIVKEWWDSFLAEAKAEFKNAKNNNLELAEKPKISSKKKIYEWKWIKSIVFEVDKKIWKYNEKTIKVFYTKDRYKFLAKNIFLLHTKHNENILLGKLSKKVNSLEWTFKDENILKDNLTSYSSNPKFYLENDKIIFLIEPNKIADLSKWIIELKFDFDEFLNILNPKVFPEVKEKLEKIKEAERKKIEEAKKSWKKLTLSEAEALEKNWWKKYIALTFDDGPNGKTTPKLLDILKKHNVKSTFFVLWKMANIYPEVLKRTHDEGHEIASHSWDHPNLMTLSKEKIQKQIKSTDDKIKEIIWKTPSLMRPPYWAHNKNIDNIIWKTIVMWDVDSMDWRNRNVEKNLKQTMAQIQNWSIILFHDIHQPSVDTIEPLIKKLREKWYEFLTVSELLEIWQNWDFARKVCHWEFKCVSY